MQAIEQILDFIVEIEKLKNVYRKTRPVGLERYENSAEHSWQICLTALMLKDFANEPIQIDRVIQMLLIHDLGEIDTGDTLVYQGQTEEEAQQEANAVKRILSILPEEMAQKYIDLWLEFEAAETADARFAKAIDRVPPILQNLNADGFSWKKHNIAKEQVFQVNQKIAKGSESLWQVIESKLHQAVEDGRLK